MSLISTIYFQTVSLLRYIKFFKSPFYGQIFFLKCPFFSLPERQGQLRFQRVNYKQFHCRDMLPSKEDTRPGKLTPKFVENCNVFFDFLILFQCAQL